MRVVVLSEEVGVRWKHYPTRPAVFFSLCGRDIIIIPCVRYAVFYCPLLSLFMVFIDLPRRYFFFSREHRTDLPGLELPKRYLFE